MPGRTILVTGANRGIGRGIFEHYLAEPDAVLIACVRNVDEAQGLLALPRGQNTAVHIVKIDSASATDALDAAANLQARGVEHIDVIVSAAGIVNLYTVAEAPLDDFELVLRINSLSVLLLYQAMRPLLLNAANKAKAEGGPLPRLAFISAAAGSVSEMHQYPFPNVSYTGSKALANVLVKKMGMEDEWLITLCIHPGLVQTDMGNNGARTWGLEKAPVTVEDCTRKSTNIIDNATKEEHSGKFFDQDMDKFHPW